MTSVWFHHFAYLCDLVLLYLLFYRSKSRLVTFSTCSQPASPNADLSLSEGFHWASVSDAPSAPPPPSVADVTRTLPGIQDPTKTPNQAPCGYQLVGKVCVKTEPNSEDVLGHPREAELSAGKRKRRKTTVSCFLQSDFCFRV